VLEEAFGELEDVGLGGARDLAATLAPGQLEGVADDLLRAAPADDLEGHGHVTRVEVLDAGVEVLDVLAHDDEVDALAVIAVGTPGSGEPGGCWRRSRKRAGRLEASPAPRLERSFRAPGAGVDLSRAAHQCCRRT
jgi:hypothetical protein